MSNVRIEVLGKNTKYTKQNYKETYNFSIENIEEYWQEKSKLIHWFTPFNKVKDTSFKYEDVKINWYLGGKTNACYNCLDVHLERKANDIAIIWEGNDKSYRKKVTYKELWEQTCKFANGLKSIGVLKGDIVTIYMPNSIEAVVAMLACARIGAIHSVVFSGFSPNALADRIVSCSSKYIITTDVSYRGDKVSYLKENVDTAIKNISFIKKVIVASYTDKVNCSMSNQDIHMQTLMQNQDTNCLAEPIEANEPLFILYTSGSTNKPKGIMHGTGGYCVYAKHTFQTSFDYSENELVWTMADIGWVTGHSYIVYGPLLSGAKVLMYEGMATFPNEERAWSMVEEYKVNILYTAPTLIRSLMKFGNKAVEKYHLDSLRIIASVGEPINLDAWEWFFEIVGKKKCPLIDTWWQTETGGHIIAPVPFISEMKPTKASLPFFGINLVLLNEKGEEIKEADTEGALCIKNSWPGQMIGIYGDRDLFISTYFSTFKGYYFSGDGAFRDTEDYYRITGRVDDVLNVSGHRLSTANLESIIDNHQNIAESAVIGIPDEIKGQAIYAFVTPYTHIKSTEGIEEEINNLIRQDLGGLGIPKFIQVVPDLPKTRSGKIMRRILRKIATGEIETIGDTSTLANPEIVNVIIKGALQ